MKTRNYFTFAFIGLIALTFAFIACEKNPSDDSLFTNDQLNVSEEDETIDALMEDVIQEVENVSNEKEDVIFDGNTMKSTLTEETCPMFSVTWINDSIRMVTLDYGDSCGILIRNRFDVVIDTVVKKGIIRFEACKRMRQTNAYRKITFENYYVNGYKIEGEHLVTNTGYNADSSRIRFTVTLRNGKITSPNGQEYTRTTNRERFWFEGIDTPSHWDDEFMIWGVVEGTNRQGKQYTRTITDSLHISAACKFILSGEIESVVEGEDPVYINYGDGECDASAQVSRNGQSEDINLRYRYRNRNIRRN